MIGINHRNVGTLNNINLKINLKEFSFLPGLGESPIEYAPSVRHGKWESLHSTALSGLQTNQGKLWNS
ncbi:hypothetical protein Misp06_01357 [Microbulbifer sp. NBRC 101763]